MAIQRHISHIKSSGGTGPQASQIEFGEIAVGYLKGDEALYIKNNSGDVVTFNTSAAILASAEIYTDTHALSSTTKYAGSSSQGGAATSAEKLTNPSAIGSGTQPVFFTANGVPSATTYSLSKSVPSNAVFTDTATTLNGHFTPTATTAGTKSANASSTSELAWGSAVITGVTLSGDAKGHITAVSVASGKLKTPTTVNNGTFTISGNGVSVASTSANASANSGVNIKSGGTFISVTTGTSELTIAAVTGTGATQLAVGNHSHTNMVTGSSLTANDIILGNGSSAVKASGKSIETTLSSTSDAKIPTSKAIATYVSQQMASALTYKGSISSNDTLKEAHNVGDLWVVSSAGTYADKSCEVGDFLIANTTRASAATVTNSDWDAINGENQVENKSASLAAAGSSATLATVDGTNITVTTPSTWTGVAKTGTVTKVSTGAGLVGGDITTTGTLKAALSSETKSTLEATAMGSTANRQYAVGLDKNGVLSVNIPWTNTNSGYVPTGRTITTASGLTGGGNLSENRTIGLETTGTSGTYGPAADVIGSSGTTIKVPQITTDAYGRVTSVTERTYTSVDHTYTVNNGTFAISGNGTSVASTSANASTNSGLNIKNGTFVSLTTGTSELTIGVSTGTSNSTLARGDHSHSTYVNQNAYSNIKIGSTTLAAASTTDTVEFATTNTSGTDGLTISGTNGAAGADKVTINLGDIVCGDYA